MSSPPVIYLDDAELAALELTPPEIADALERVLRAQARGEATTCPKATVLPGESRLFMATLAHAEDPPYAVTKMVGLSPDNADAGLPSIGSLISLLDGRTGMPVAVMGGTYITAVRTAAMTVVAARRMARPESETVLFVGCGVQARSHLDALRAEFPLRRVIANSRTRRSAEAFAELAAGLGLEVEVADEPMSAFGRADIIITSVSYDERIEPFLDATRLLPGTFAGIVDIARPWQRDSLRTVDCLVIDDLEQEALLGPCVDLDSVGADLMGLVNDPTGVGQLDGKVRAFVSRGMGFGDLAMAALAYERARDTGRGLVLPA